MTEQAAAQTRRKFEASVEDRARLTRLYGEIEGRYAEMALMIGRILGFDHKGERFAFSLPPHFPWAKVAGSKKVKDVFCGKSDGGSDGGNITTLPGMTIVITKQSDGGVAMGVYDHGEGTCQPVEEDRM